MAARHTHTHTLNRREFLRFLSIPLETLTNDTPAAYLRHQHPSQLAPCWQVNVSAFHLDPVATLAVSVCQSKGWRCLGVELSAWKWVKQWIVICLCMCYVLYRSETGSSLAATPGYNRRWVKVFHHSTNRQDEDRRGWVKVGVHVCRWRI